MKPRAAAGRKAIPHTIRGQKVADQHEALARALCDAVQRRLLDGETDLGSLARAMRSEAHIVARYLADPTRVNSLRHASALAMAAGLRLRLVVEAVA